MRTDDYLVKPVSRRTLIVSSSRVAAIQKALEENEEEINNPRTLRIEINCGEDEFSFSILSQHKFAHRASIGGILDRPAGS